MDLVTLEDRFQPTLSSGVIGGATTPPKTPTVTSRAPENTNPTQLRGEIPHFSWILNDDLLYDAIGSDRTSYKGSAFGMMRPETVRPSGVGMFQTKYGQPILIISENHSGDHPNPYYGILAQTGAYGADPVYINIRRGEGPGYHERWLMPQLRTTALAALEKIEAQGPSMRLVVVRIQGAPTTWRYVGELAQQWADIAINLALDFAAPYAAGILGVTADDILKSAPLLKSLAKGEAASVEMLAQAASLVAPKGIRAELDKAQQFYKAYQRGNYQDAAKIMGIDASGVEKIINQFSAGVDNQAAKAAQNVYIMDTINQVRRRAKSGSAQQEIIDQGTLTRSAPMQNLLLTAVSSITSAVPRLPEIVGIVAKETDDIESAQEWRSFLQMAHGLPVTDGSLDRLALRGLVERARQIKAMGLTEMNMPDLVPEGKRQAWADEIRSQTGVNASGSSSLTPIILLGMCGAAGYFLLKK